MGTKYAYFSGAIKEGAKLRPQTWVALYDEVGTCAVGAGLHAMFLEEAAERRLFKTTPDVLDAFPYMSSIAACPAQRKWWQPWKICICKGAEKETLVMLCQHLNDFHKWTREAIAEWLYEEEEKLGYITVSDEGFGSTQQLSGSNSQHVESQCSLQPETESVFTE